jgi:hypothetical protein
MSKPIPDLPNGYTQAAGHIVEWVFPVEDNDDPELGYAVAHRTRDFRQRHTEVPRGPMRFVIGDDGTLVFMEAQIPLLRAFLKAFDAAPQGSEFVTCARCGCRTVWVYAELRGTDNNTGTTCDDHDCRHGAWNTRRDARCKFCGEGLRATDEGSGVVEWVCAWDDTSLCSQSPENPPAHKPVS